MQYYSVFPSENHQILESLDGLVQNITESQKEFYRKITEIRNSHYMLVKGYYKESQKLIKMLKETASLCSLMFSIEDEKNICVSTINILRQLFQEAVAIRILCASSSRTKLETVAVEKSAGYDINSVCSKTPFNCIVIKACRPIVYSPSESTIPCPEMLNSPD
ncbi:hypothetical protein, partial [Desulfofundulus sp.]|uniref:hypothetical protein n=1 Tax=Desulfofundulus sp. TaxID=2282750 RepID=UPI003C732A3F